MKHLILFSAFVLLLTSSCSKVQRMSRRIDGDWKATRIFGNDLEGTGEEWTFHFEKDRKGKGTGTITIKSDSETIVHKTTYRMKRDDRMNITVGTEIGEQLNLAWEIKDFTKEKLRVLDVYGDEAILIKQ